MTQLESSPVGDLVGHTAVDADGDKVGTVSDVYVDNQTSEPAWLAVTTGMFGTKVSFVPIADAYLDGDDIVVAFSKDHVKAAPNVEADGQLSEQEVDDLYAHYGHQPTARTTPDRALTGDDGHDTSGPDTDDAMTRSEEQLDVGTHTRQTGTARLRKWIETEDVHMVVPIRREKARMVTEPITDSNREAAMSGGDLTEEDHEVTLSEEVIDVDKHVEAKERVRLETDVDIEEVAVDEQVRKERIEFEGDPDAK